MYSKLINDQREYFLNGNTKDFNVRIKNLKAIKQLLIKYKDKILDAFILDLNKSEFDTLSCEYYMTIDELDYMIKHLKKYLKDKHVSSNLVNIPSKGIIKHEPYGVVLIMAPWNYPLQLSLIPLVGAIACGNTVILKPSEYSVNVSNVLDEMFKEFNNPSLVSVVLGGVDETTNLLKERFDYIFFTGSSNVAKIVMRSASEHLTPLTLELGGKSPCIVAKDADLDIAAKRISWGKFLNAGQTCVAPDYILVNKDIKDEFIKKVIYWTKKMHYTNDGLSKDFTKIINERHLNRLKGLIDDNKVIFGGTNKDTLLEPTIMDNVTFDDKVMQEEIFGPIMPIITYDDLDELINKLKHLEKPLALYYFGKNKEDINKVTNSLYFGGGCINDTIMHLTNNKLPFNGVGNSGMGTYHGKKSLDTFSYTKSIFIKPKMELDVKFAPITDKKLKTFKKITKIK